MSGFSRPSFLLGSGAAALLAACGGDDDGAGPTTSAVDGDAPVLGAAFDRSALLVTGTVQRAPFLLFDAAGGLVPADQAPAELTFELVAESGPAPAAVTVARHGDDIERPYWPVTTTFESTGVHVARVDLDGTPLEFAVNVSEPDAIAVPQVGAALPSVPTPTTADALGAATICTQEPPCPLHAVSLDAALAEGRRVALLVSTPAFCQVAVCGPVLDLLVAAAPDHPDIAMIHLDVYPGGEAAAESLSPVVRDTLGLAYEPVLFVADASGTITSRLDNIYDGAELAEALGGVGA